MTASPTPSRPRVVEIAFWALVAGAVLLIFGGLLAVTVTFETARTALTDQMTNDQVSQYLTVYRGVGAGSIVGGGGLAFVASRARRGDAKFRRATVGLSLAIAVVLILLAAGAKVGQPVTLLALVPIAVGTVMLTRGGANEWFASRESR
jgi:heme/copper-type cytochrome/quinol oxidase subunit 1